MPNYDIEATNAKIFSKLGLFSMNGRRNRKPYIIFNALTGVMQHWIALLTNDEVILLFFFILTYMSFNNAAKRFQDLDHPGWLGSIMLLPLIPVLFGNGVINVVFLWGAIIPVNLYLTFLKGTAGSNSYGPDPLGNENLPATNQEAQLDNDNPQGKAKMYVAIIFVLVIAFALTSNNNGVKEDEQIKPVNDNPKQTTSKNVATTPKVRWEPIGSPFDFSDLDTESITKEGDIISFWIRETITANDIEKNGHATSMTLRKVNIKSRKMLVDKIIKYKKDGSVHDVISLHSMGWIDIVPETINEHYYKRVKELTEVK